jgi:hypothetical protein
MRECLGWVSNCGDESSCSQNWLERAVTEIPTTVSCCGHTVHLVSTVSEFKEKVAQNLVAAVPVVPCCGQAVVYEKLDLPIGSAAPASPSREPEPPPIEPEVHVDLYCLLSNGDRIKCDKDTMIVGRSRTCDIVLPSAKVSRQHASVNRRGGQWMIEDMGSANGVWIDGQRISQAVAISEGDVYTVSDETLTFQFR